MGQAVGRANIASDRRPKAWCALDWRDPIYGDSRYSSDRSRLPADPALCALLGHQGISLADVFQCFFERSLQHSLNYQNFEEETVQRVYGILIRSGPFQIGWH